MSSNNTEADLQKLMNRLSPEALDKFEALPASLQSKILNQARDAIQFHTTPKVRTARNREAPKAVNRFKQSTEEGMEELASLLGVTLEEKKPDAILEEADRLYEEAQNEISPRLSLPLNAFSKDHKELSMGTVKLEITSTREGFFQAGGCMSAVLAFVFLVSEAGSFWVIMALGGMIYFIKTLFQTDDYLVVEPDLKKIRYHKEFKGKVNMEDFLSFAQIAFLAVNGKKHESDKKVSWNYQLVAITVDGDIIPLSDEKSCEFLECFSFTAALCKKVGLQLAPGASPETSLAVIGSGSRLQIEYHEI